VDGQLAANANSFHSYPAGEALAGIEAGFERVELCAVPGWTEHVDLGRPLALHGCALTAVSLAAHSDLTTRDGLDHGLRAVQWAAENSVPIVNTAIGGHASIDEDEDAFLRQIDTLARAAEEAGVTLTLEIHGGSMASGALAVPLLERIGRPSLRVNYDTGNAWYYGAVRAADDLPAIVERVAHVHLKDVRGAPGTWDFPALGEGDVDFGRVLAILRDADYTGPLSIELEFQGEPWPAHAAVVDALRRSREHLLAFA
jgi:sugar phosphate isomerase/epimerase